MKNNLKERLKKNLKESDKTVYQSKSVEEIDFVLDELRNMITIAEEKLLSIEGKQVRRET